MFTRRRSQGPRRTVNRTVRAVWATAACPGQISNLRPSPWEIDLHGHQVVYRAAGSGPPVVLVHGMVNSSRHWRQVALRLAERHTVIAPDLVGHGDSATPRGD